MSGFAPRAVAALALLGLAACGGSGGGSRPPATPTPDSTPAVSPTTPSRTTTPAASPTPGGAPSILPPICTTGRVVFRASNGESCCVAVDPALLPEKPRPGQETLVLDDLPIGPATVAVAGYTEDFAPAPPGVAATCKTLNTNGVKPCDPTRNASAAYESDAEPVTIFAGVRVNLGTVDVAALPFVLDYVPPQNSEVPLPVEMDFTVVDAASGIAAESVGLEISLDVPQGEPPVFRPITKRVPLELIPCLDGSGRPCSPDGSLDLSGFTARGVAEYLEYLPAGPVEARITAQNLADPPRDLDFRYVFVVAPGATATPVANAAAAEGGSDAGALVWAPTATPTATPELP